MALVSPLLRLENNHCHIEESEYVLKKAHKYSELIILYEKKGLHQKGTPKICPLLSFPPPRTPLIVALLRMPLDIAICSIYVTWILLNTDVQYFAIA